MDDLVERKLEMLFRDLKPYADKSIGSLRIGMDEVHAILALEARIQALETSLAEAEGRVIAEVVKWLRHPDRRKFIEMKPAMEGYWTQDEEPEWVPSRSALKRLPTHKDFATALETGEWKK